MSVSPPEYIAETEAWKGAIAQGSLLPVTNYDNNLAENALDPFEELTSTRRVKELQKLLVSNRKSAVDPTCVRSAANWATVDKHHKFDTEDFNAAKTSAELVSRSPKLAKILQNIRKFDREDEARYGRRFKHFIFSDIKGAQGAKAIASALIAGGYTFGFAASVVETAPKKSGVSAKKSNKPSNPPKPPNKKKTAKIRLSVKTPAELLKTRGNNFFFLSSVGVYGEPLFASVKKEALKKFNSRPDNVYGDLARIIVMDSGFKEGIDLFDIKYVHIFEPQTTMADQKQVIGRGTRTCGQKGLQFNPRVGWPLYVFKYDLSIAPEYRPDFRDSETAFAYYLKSKNIDIRLINLASNLENLVIKGSVDYSLNKPVHRFSADKNAVLSRGGGPDSDDEEDEEEPPAHLRTAEENLMRKLSADSRPGKKYKAVKKYVKKYFSEFKWPPVAMENLCGYEGPALPPLIQKSLDLVVADKKERPIKTLGGALESSTPYPYVSGGAPILTSSSHRELPNESSTPYPYVSGGAPNLITLSPTQEFISNYFSAANPLKGMVLWQSVGTGKTCTAIATATRQFEPLGYTILWVTRTTLKNDIWKNMFEMVCHEDIRDKVAAGVHVPDNQPGRMKLLSKSWGIRPISYKQFSNLVSKNNRYYDLLVKRNGEDDPLRKTLLIIDEAHKLYGGGDLSSIERPDMPAFHRALMNSYAVSGADSVRVLFMTATPITESPLELVKLVNLCRTQNQQIPTEFEQFADRFLDETGDFTAIGKKLFLDDIAGHISYLNREGDVRQFARPILREVLVPLVDAKTAKDIDDFDVVGATEMDRQISDLQSSIDDAKSRYKSSFEEFTKANVAKVAKVCNEYGEDARKDCYKIAKKYSTQMVKTAKDRAVEWKTRMTDIAAELKTARSGKSDRFKTVRQTRKDYPQEYEDYQKSAYYKLKECDVEWKDAPHFNQYLETQPAFTKARDLEDAIQEELKMVESQLKADISSQQSKIKSYNNLLKTELLPNETQVVRLTIKDARAKLDKSRKRNVKWMQRITKRANLSIDRLKKFQKEVKKEIRSVIKEQLREEKVFAKEEEKERKLEETADEDLSENFNEILRQAQEGVRSKMVSISDELKAKHQKLQEKEHKVREKQEAKDQKEREKQQKEREKQQKEREKQEAKDQKEREKQQKEREKQQKEREKQQKEREKQEAKDQKEREKQEAKDQKEREKQEKEREKQEAKEKKEQKKKAKK